MISARRLKNCRAFLRNAEASGTDALQSSRVAIIFRETFGHAVGIFAENTFSIDAVDLLRSAIIAGLNPREPVFAVHDVWFAVDDRAAIKPRRQQIARVNIAARSNFRGGERGWILIGRKTGRF